MSRGDGVSKITKKKIIIAIIYGESYLESYEKIYDIITFLWVVSFTCL